MQVQNLSLVLLQIEKLANAKILKSKLLRSEKVLDCLYRKESKFITAKWICDLLDDFNNSKLEYSTRLDAIKDLNFLLDALLDSEYVSDLFPGIISSVLKIVDSNGKVVLRDQGLSIFSKILLNQKSEIYKEKILRLFQGYLSRLVNDYSQIIRKSYGELLVSLINHGKAVYLEDYIYKGLLELSLDEYAEIAIMAKSGLSLKPILLEKFSLEIQYLNFGLDKNKSNKNIKVLKGILGIFKDSEQFQDLQKLELGFSLEYVENLLKGLDIKLSRKIDVLEIPIKEYQMPVNFLEINRILQFQNLSSLQVSSFFQLWSQSMSFSQLQEFIINLIPFANADSTLFYQPQALFVLGSVIQGMKKEKGLDKEEIRFLKKVFKDLVGFKLCNLPLNKNQQILQIELEDSSPWNHLANFYSLEISKSEHGQRLLLSNDDYQRNALISCLFLSILSDLSSVLLEQFEPFLIDGLYPILEKLGNSNGVVSLAAWKSLSEIANNMSCRGAQNDDKVKALLINNVDYVINHVSRNLRSFQSHPYAPNVLSATIRIVGLKILDFMDDSILELLDLLGEYHNVNGNVIQVILSVFHSLADVMEKTNSKQEILQAQDFTSKMDFSGEFGNASAEIIEFFIKNRNSHIKNESDDNESINSAKEFFLNSKGGQDVENEEEENVDDQVIPTSNHTDVSKQCKFAGQILPKLIHFLTVDSPQLRKYVIEILGKLVPFLKEREPFIHTVWSSLANRLNDTEYYVVKEAFYVISVISNLSPEFVSKRISDDVISKILVLLTTMDKDLKESILLKANCMSSSAVSSIVLTPQKYSKKLNIMVGILGHIQSLLRSISVNYLDTKNLTLALIPLLHQDYPKDISLFSISILRNLMSKNHSDLVYLLLWISCSASELVPFNSNLKSLSITLSMIQKSDRYLVNSSSILGCPLSSDWKETAIINGTWKKKIY